MEVVSCSTRKISFASVSELIFLPPFLKNFAMSSVLKFLTCGMLCEINQCRKPNRSPWMKNLCCCNENHVKDHSSICDLHNFHVMGIGEDWSSILSLGQLYC